MALVDELPYRPFAERGQIVDGRFRWRLGVRPLDLDHWFEFGADGDAWVAEKPAIIEAHRSQVLVALDDAEPECREIADAVAAHLGVEWDRALHPLEAAARLVPDDLVVMVERPGPDGEPRLVFGAGCVCFPNRWDLPSKLGLSMAEVHEPVADLNAQLGPAVDSFLDRLAPERSFWRLGWGIIDSAEGYEPLKLHPTHADPATDGLHLRVERETLRRFGGTGAILFGIRTYLTPLSAAASDAVTAGAVADAVSAMSPPVKEYKSLSVTAGAVVDYLRSQVVDNSNPDMIALKLDE